MNFVKKITALGLAVAMASGFAACSTGEDTKWVAKFGETTVPAGVYIGQMITAYPATVDPLGADIKNPMKEQVDGVPVPQKIAEDAKKGLANYIAVEKKFDEMELTLSDSDKAITVQMANEYWVYVGEAYQANGISQETYTAILTNEMKKSVIFKAVYDKDGTDPVPETELREKFEKDYAKIAVIPLSFSTETDPDKKAGDDKATRDMIAKYEQLAKDGRDMEELIYEARKEIMGEEIEKPAPGASFTIIERGSGQFEDNMMEAVFAAKVGTPTVVESETEINLFVRYEPNDDDFNSRRSSLVTALRQDDFDKKIEEWAAAMTDVTYNEKALSRYTPQKLKLD